MKRLPGLIEPVAEKGWLVEENTTDAEDTALCIFSIAISLKRIADRLDEGVFNQPLNQYGETIGECIEGQFNRSR